MLLCRGTPCDYTAPLGWLFHKVSWQGGQVLTPAAAPAAAAAVSSRQLLVLPVVGLPRAAPATAHRRSAHSALRMAGRQHLPASACHLTCAAAKQTVIGPPLGNHSSPSAFTVAALQITLIPEPTKPAASKPSKKATKAAQGAAAAASVTSPTPAKAASPPPSKAVKQLDGERENGKNGAATPGQRVTRRRAAAASTRH